MLFGIISITFINLDVWLNNKIVDIEHKISKDCLSCQLQDAYEERGIKGLESQLNIIFNDEIISYTLLKNTTPVGGTLTLSDSQIATVGILSERRKVSQEQWRLETPTVDIDYNEGYVIHALHFDTLFTLVVKKWLNVRSSDVFQQEQREALNEKIKHVTYRVVEFSVAIVVLGFLVTCGIAWGIHNKLREINKATTSIIERKDLSERIEVTKGNTEMHELVANLNKMLSEMESSFDALKHLSNNIAHDLRTPLTSLKALVDGLDTEDIEPSLILTQIDQILETFNAILRISFIESQDYSANLGVVDLSNLVGDVISLFEPIASNNGQKLIQKIDLCEVKGDANLLFQALVNLVENSIKYSGIHSEITIHTAQQHDMATIQIIDNGPGVPDKIIENITDRFTRGDEARCTPGSGLGLSMVKAIAGYHKGTLTVRNINSGFEVTLSFPN